MVRACKYLLVLPTILGPIRELHSSNKQRKALVFKTSIFVKFINKTLFLEIYNCFLLQVFRPSSYSFPSPPPLLHPHSSTLSLWIITECGGSRWQWGCWWGGQYEEWGCNHSWPLCEPHLSIHSLHWSPETMEREGELPCQDGRLPSAWRKAPQVTLTVLTTATVIS